MADKSGIQWTDATWNIVRGCSRVSPGCQNCYAERQAHRFSGKGGAYEGLTRLGPNGPRWTGEVRLVPELLDQPARWKRPRRIFVNSMSDLFHEKLAGNDISLVFEAMALAPQHTFQVLTKRAERMCDWFDSFGAQLGDALGGAWPLPNVWLGVSVEDQQRADERIPYLMDTPAAVRFLSCEPLLGPLNLRAPLGSECPHDDSYTEYDTNALVCRKCDERPFIDWVIVGGESGHGARSLCVNHIRDIIEDCKRANVPCFVKQLGAHPYEITDPDFMPHTYLLADKKGGDINEWPDDLRVRQFPEVSL